MKKKFQNNYKQLHDEESGKLIKVGDTVYVPRKRKNGKVERVAADATLLVNFDGELLEFSFTSVQNAREEQDCTVLVEENKRLKQELDECTMSLTLVRNPVVDVLPEKVRASLPETATENAVKKIVDATMTLVEESKNENSYGSVIEAEQEIKQAVEEIKQNAARTTINVTSDCIAEIVVVRDKKTVRVMFRDNQIPNEKIKDKLKKHGFSWYRFTAEEKQEKNATGYWGAFHNEKRQNFAQELCGGSIYKKSEFISPSTSAREIKSRENYAREEQDRQEKYYEHYADSDDPQDKFRHEIALDRERALMVDGEDDEDYYIPTNEEKVEKIHLPDFIRPELRRRKEEEDRRAKEEEEDDESYSRMTDKEKSEYNITYRFNKLKSNIVSYMQNKQLLLTKTIVDINMKTLFESDRVYDIGDVDIERINERQIAFNLEVNGDEKTMYLTMKKDNDILDWVKETFVPVSQASKNKEQKNSPPVDEKAEALKMFRKMIEEKLNKK